MSEQVLLRIEKRLDQMLRLLAKSSVDQKTKSEAIEILAASGLDRLLIAELLDTTPGTVSVTLSLSRSRKKPLKKAEANIEDETSTQ